MSLTGRWASDVIKTLPSTISRQNKYYFMGEGRVRQECEGGREGSSLAVIGVLQRGGSKWPNMLGGIVTKWSPSFLGLYGVGVGSGRGEDWRRESPSS